MRVPLHGLLVAVAVPLLAGCFGMCGYTPESAVWKEDGLAAWLDAHPVPRATRSTTQDAGLPFDAELDGVRPQALRSVTWQPTQDHGASFVSMDANGMLWTSGHKGSEDDARRIFRQVAVNVSAANASALRDAEEAFIASAEGGEGEEMAEDGSLRTVTTVSYHSRLPGPYRLEDLVTELGVAWPEVMIDPYRDAGTVTAAADGWSFEFVVAYWTIPLDRGAIKVDVLDRVAVSGAFAEDDDDADIERKVRRAFAEAGLPDPHLQDMTHGGSIC